MNLDALMAAAQRVRANAYAPYSRYSVGAAVLGADGTIYTGCNVENSSYGLTVCAERAAIIGMVSAGCTKLIACAVATANGAPPCGACLQVIAEFAEHAAECEIVCVSESGDRTVRTLSELLPSSFRL